MQLEAIVSRHEEQILSIKDCLSDMTIKINRLVDHHAHSSEKLEEVLEFIKSSRDFSHRINGLENKIIDIIEKSDKLFEVSVDHKDKIKTLESRQLSVILSNINEYWPLILFILAIAGWAIDFIYHVKT